MKRHDSTGNSLLTDLDFEAIERRKMIKGMKELNKRCHCGTMKVNHTTQQANACKKEKQTETVGKIATEKEIDQMRLSKT